MLVERLGLERRSWRCVIEGELASKANSRRPVTVGRGRFARTRIIKSAKALGFVEGARRQLYGRRPMLTGPLRMVLRIYYRTERPDLDESLVLDLLQGFAYANDRQVRERHVYHGIDKERPRVEVLVQQIGEGEDGVLGTLCRLIAREGLGL